MKWNAIIFNKKFVGVIQPKIYTARILIAYYKLNDGGKVKSGSGYYHKIKINLN